MTEIWYTTRERVKRALDVAETARNDTQVDEAIAAATPVIEDLCHRVFYPWVGIRYFDHPPRQNTAPWRLWLNGNDLISATSVVSGGTTIDPGDYLLEPANSGPPYTTIEIDLSSSASWSSDDTSQRATVITGTWGYRLDSRPAGVLDVAVATTTETTIAVTDSAAAGVGDLLLIGSERLAVTGKSWVSTGLNLETTDLTDSAADVSVTMSGTTDAPVAGETIMIDSEVMLVVAVAGTSLTVRRGWDGSVLAAHTAGAGTLIYAPRILTVERGVLGTTAATHLIAAAISRHRPPPLVRGFAVALAMNTLLQEESGYARIAGSGDYAREYLGRGLESLSEQVYTSHGRKARGRAV